MNTRIILCGLALGMATMSWAQTSEGGISQEMLKVITAAGPQTQAERALQNALLTNSIDALAKGKAQMTAVPSQFSIETPKQSITDQKSSGRCWMFSSMNVLRADFAAQCKGAAENTDAVIEFSQDHLFFWDQLEKANLMLQGCINTAKKDINDAEVQWFFQYPLSDGGTFCGAVDLVAKYGLVPKEIVPETFSSESTSVISRLLRSKLREFGLKLRKMVADGKKPAAVNTEKTAMLKVIYGMLCQAYGTPVQKFTYAFTDKDGKVVGEEKTYTPQEFAVAVGAVNLDSRYLMVMNDPRHEYGKVYEIEMDRHTQDGHNWRYLNLAMEDIEALAIASLKGGQKMYSSYDVGKFLDRKRGFAALDNFNYEDLFQTSFPMTKRERLLTRDSGSTHAMTLTAVNLDKEGKPTMWKVENSWGSDSGQKGCLVMTAEWFREYMFRLVVEKKYASEKLLKMAEQKPVMLKYDDALFDE